jgi:regulator of protease activity HflC (stomatin/prohibitin superfamily)
MELLIPAGLVILLVLLVVRTQVRALTVYEFERGLKYRRGRFIAVVGPGGYWHRPAVTSFQKVDGRATFVSITGQEVLSSDGVTSR